MSRILVADDNSNIQKMVALALKDEGIDVVAVGNGDAAMRKIPDLRPDLVLADIFMPVRNGYEVCEFIKSDSRYMNTPVVLLVGAFDPLDEDETQRVRADGVLKKPFVPPDPLINMVKALLAKSNGQNSTAVPAAPAVPAAATPAKPALEPQATVVMQQPPAATNTVAPAKIAREQNQPPKSVAPQPSYASEAAKFDEAEEVTTAIRDPNLGEPAWAAPEEPEEAEQGVEESAEAEDMVDMHSFGERGDSGRFRPDSTIFDKMDDAPAGNKKKALPKVEAVEMPSADRKSAEADVKADKPVEAAAAEVRQAAPEAVPEAEETPVEPFKFDPTLTFSAATETTVEPQELMPLPEAPLVAAEAPAEGHAFQLEGAPLEEPVSEHGATVSWPTLAELTQEMPAGPAIPVEAHTSIEPAEMHLPSQPDQEAMIQAATEAARTAFSELKTFAGVIPSTANASASEPTGQAANGQAGQGELPSGPAGIASTEGPKATPEMIDAVVSKLLERMQPQIMEVVNREVLRPAIEEIVRREMEKS